MLPLRLLTAILTLLTAAASTAGPDIWVHDKQTQLAIVDVGSGHADIIGSMGVEITDIAFAPDGRLFGLSADDFYEIDRDTAALTLIGPHGIREGNALVFETDDIVYAAGYVDDFFYQIDPNTGDATALFDIGVQSAGDLAFHQGELYLSTRDSELVRIDRVAQSGTIVGPLGFPSVFGLATGDDGVLYGISGKQIFSVNTTTGAGTEVSNYGGQGLDVAFGSSFFGEALPICAGEPLVGCLVAGKAKLVVNDKADGREKFKLALGRFDEATGQADFGNPVTGTTLYEVCVYDQDLESAVRLTIDRAGDFCGSKQKPCWKAKSTKGYTYKDPAAESSGIKKISGVSGPLQKGKLAVLGANNARKRQLALPSRIALRLEGHTSALVQVSAGAQCFEADLGTVKKSTAAQFNAKTP